MKEILKEREKGRFPLYRAKIALYEGLGDEWLVNMSQLDDVNAVIPEEVTAAEIEGRRQIEYIISFLILYATRVLPRILETVTESSYNIRTDFS